MHKYVKRYREDPFFRSTWNVIFVQTLFALLITLVCGFAIYHQQQATQHIIDVRRAAVAAGQTLNPQTLDAQLYSLRNNTLGITLLVLIVLAAIFGYLSGAYALNPTRQSLGFQKRFIGNLAHELRTPLSIIRTSSEVALMDKSLNDYTRSTLNGTIEELDRVSAIINNLLSFDSLMRPGQIRFEPVNLHETAHEVVARHKEMAQSYGIALALDATGEPAYVLGNKVALEQVLTNIVKNALNYTPQHDGRNVVVRIDDADNQVSASVIDTGIGIAQKDLYYVFQPYYRGDTSRERGIGSGTSGLGLAIVNDIVRAHSGSIVIRSALNRGTTIELTFPKADTRNYVKAIAKSEDDDQEYQEDILTRRA
ncbi:MAG: phoS [Parcubacteria group bacterium]|nr:phoS [Parcubacteria group bacterium]